MPRRCAETLENALDRRLDVLGATVQAFTGLAGGKIDIESELAREDDVVAYALQRLPHHLFGNERPMKFGGIDQRNALFDRLSDERDRSTSPDGAAEEVLHAVLLIARTPLASKTDGGHV